MSVVCVGQNVATTVAGCRDLCVSPLQLRSSRLLYYGLKKRLVLHPHSLKRRAPWIWLLIASLFFACVTPGQGISFDRLRPDRSHSADISVTRASSLAFSQARITRIQLKNGCHKKTIPLLASAKLGLSGLTASWLLLQGSSQSYAVDLSPGSGRSPPLAFL
jgi:hypothetical protein